MAELVLGLASSHSPQLSTPPDGWAQRGEWDKGNPELIGTDGITSNYEDLLARADVSRIAGEITPEKFQKRHEQNQKAISRLAESLYRANLDVLVMVGDDQQEYLRDDNMPGFCI
ncbi:MAG TPA: extradiol ring-cleavage dioxygenase, partial [Dehalococcoidia bacterium]|nr:extradiol ring-cleavage dioxygenase [Dehalococcoidia bacterium]